MQWPRVDRSNSTLAKLARPVLTKPAPARLTKPDVLPGADIADAYITPDGDLVLEFTEGTQRNLGRVRGRDGLAAKTPKKDVDYRDGADGVSVTGAVLHGTDLVLNLSNGKNITVGRVVGKDGYTPKKGKDYRDGEPGYTPVKGKDYDDGAPGERGVGVESGRIAKGHLLLQLTSGTIVDCGALPVAEPLPPAEPRKGDPGDPGPTGPTPRHEIKGESIRFALVMSKNGAKVLKWGEWLHLGRLVRDLTRQRRPGHVSGAAGISEARVLQLIEAHSMPAEDFDPVYLDNQTSDGTVLTFTFDADVQKVWVKLLPSSDSDTSTAYVRADGGVPDADTGTDIEAGVPQPITAETSVVKVLAPNGKTVNVYGYRRKA